MTIKHLLFLFLFLSFFFYSNSCQPKRVKITPAFYHWQTTFNLSELEKDYINALKAQKIYPKFFDVDWNFNQQEAVALATLQVKSEFPIVLEMTPTVFITNRTLIHISEEKLAGLAQKIIQKLNGQLLDFPTHNIKEIQFDCDWTQSTKGKYFQLLQLIKKGYASKNINLSATIRLHQIKYADKTGIPPVQRGMLMYYNMGKVQDRTTKNSILDNEIGQQYLENLRDYPLPLDIALPLFQWGVLFRNGKMIKLLNQLKASELSDSQRFNKVDENYWKIEKSTYLNGYYLYEGDKIRLEKTTLTDLKVAANLLNNHLRKENRKMVFYHLDSMVIEQFSVEKLGQIIITFE